jgi:hypothetical protein
MGKYDSLIRSNGLLGICWEAQITPGDLYISVIGQFSPPDFVLGNTLEAGLM